MKVISPSIHLEPSLFMKALLHLGGMDLDERVKGAYLVKDAEFPHWVIVEEGIGDCYEVIPFRIHPSEGGLSFETVTILLSPNEFQSYLEGVLDLPEGWGDLVQVL